MFSWFAKHLRLGIALMVASALVLGLGVVWVVRSIEGASRQADCSSLTAPTFGDASALASDCGSEVEVVAERTAWMTTWMSPTSEVRLEVSTMPVRANVDGEWVKPDTTIIPDPAEDALTVVAPVYPMSLNAGGPSGHGDPLGTVTRNGQQLEVWFPLALPVPEIDGSQASYDLGDGITLHVSISVDGTGFVPVVELADATAAETFTALLEAARAGTNSSADGSEIEFEVQASEGLVATTDDEGSVNFVDEEGESQFIAASPIMWDSSGIPAEIPESATEVGAPDRTRSPADGDQIATMDVSVDEDGGAIVVAPDESMLSSAATTWPVYIDPPFGAVGAAKWVAVRSGGYTGTLYKWGDISSTSQGQGTGYCTAAASCVKVFKQRLAWEYSGLDLIGGLVGTDISEAKFRVNGVHAASCTATRTNLVRTSALSTGTTWSNLSWSSSDISYRTETHSASCGTPGFREFNALAGARYVADNDKKTLSMGLRVENETNMTSWKRFRANATLSIKYNRKPDVPTERKFASPFEPLCTAGSGRPVIASTTPVLSAKSNDPDPSTVTTTFELVSLTAPTIKLAGAKLPFAVKNLERTFAVPSGVLSTGNTYMWRAMSEDPEGKTSDWSGWCEFTVDTSKPDGPAVTAVPNASGANAIYVNNVSSGGVGLSGSFEIDRGNQPDVVSFVYGFNAPTLPLTATVLGGKAIVSYTPTVSGPVTLTVKSKDAAGNLSLSTNYSFEVAVPAEDAIWVLDEGQGTTSADTSGFAAGPLALSGANWGDGPHALFDSRPGDHALQLDGVDDFASTESPIVDTRKSFVVSAHVRLDASTIGQGQSYTAISQDGIQNGVQSSGFRLEYAGSCPNQIGGCWSFSMPDGASGTVEAAAFSSISVKPDEWTYLVGEHDVTEHKVRLWVCDIGTPEDPAPGDPVRSQATRSSTTAWAASGALTVGRSTSAGVSSEYWPGSIDNIRVFSNSVVAESKIRRLCQGAETTDFEAGDTALDPTEAVD